MIEILEFGLSNNQGGIESYLLKICKYMDKEKFHFNFIDITGEGNRPCFYDELSKMGCSFYKITPRSKSPLKNRRELELLFKKNKFDILHFNINTASYILPIAIAIKNNCKVIVHSRNAGAADSLVTKFLHIVNKHRLNTMPIKRIAVSDLAGKWLFGKRSKYQVFNNGVDVSNYMFRPYERNKLRDDVLGKENNNKIIVGNVGAFLPAKNHLFIIDVYEKILLNIPNVVLWLVGVGPLEKKMKEYVKQKELSNSVFFLGKRSDMGSIYSAFDVFLFPSLFEGFPNALLEAECSGLTCFKSSLITSEVDVCDNVVTLDLEDGPEKWATSICDFLKNKPMENDRKINAKKLNDSEFSLKAEIKRIEELYNSVLRG